MTSVVRQAIQSHRALALERCNFRIGGISQTFSKPLVIPTEVEGYAVAFGYFRIGVDR
jgi:hypothetical protein